MFQDNEPTMYFEINGLLLSSKQTKYVKARYYFIKDKIDDGDIEVQHCPTEKMWSNVTTKPKHCTPFKRGWATLMNVALGYGN